MMALLNALIHVHILHWCRVHVLSIGSKKSLAKSFQKLQEIPKMGEISLSNHLTRNVIEIEFDDILDHVNDLLNLLASGNVSFTYLEEFYHVFRENDFTDFKVNLLVH